MGERARRWTRPQDGDTDDSVGRTLLLGSLQQKLQAGD
jgi:hypothetical protein